jgi:hypothetical protein
MAKETARKSAASNRKQSGADAPKRGLSAYMFFSQDQREKVKNDNPEASFGKSSKLARHHSFRSNIFCRSNRQNPWCQMERNERRRQEGKSKKFLHE